MTQTEAVETTWELRGLGFEAYADRGDQGHTITVYGPDPRNGSHTIGHWFAQAEDARKWAGLDSEGEWEDPDPAGQMTLRGMEL